MRLEITCHDRLGICHEVLTILKEYEIDLRGIELDAIGKIYLSFPSLEFEQLKLLLPKIRRIPQVEDVKTIPYLPVERGQFEFDLLLSALPNPVLSVDLKGQINIANTSIEVLLKKSKGALKGQSVSEHIPDFPMRWFDEKPTETRIDTIKLGQFWYQAQILPIWLKAQDKTHQKSFAGAVLHCHEQPLPHSLNDESQVGSFSAVLTESTALQRILKDAERMAQLQAPLLIEGETGVGKELVARACHEASQRAQGPFLAVNCGALPDNVAESELFGYGAGVFTHHPQGKKGIFEQADKGTVLLDSIADMSKELQAKLLRFLEDGSFRRIGEEQMVQVDVRLICLARGDLLDKVEKGIFREDLYYRLNVLSLYLPPLRERKGDIQLLTEHFIYKFCHELKRPLAYISDACLAYLQQYSWPGNIRQLENTLYRAISMLEGETIEVRHVKLPESLSEEMPIEIDLGEETLDSAVKRYERSILKRLYPRYPSTRQLAAQLGLSHTAIANKLREYGIGKKRK